MKKKLLFVIPGLLIGGAEKSLVNLLAELDYDRYEADVLVLSPVGEFMSLIPERANILPQPKNFSKFSTPVHKSIFSFLKKGRVDLAFFRLVFFAKNISSKNSTLAEQRNWRLLRHFFDSEKKQYDSAIGYLEKTANYFVAEKVNAAKKIAWIHTDLLTAGFDLEIEQNRLQNFNYLITVSEDLKDRNQEYFPKLKEKIHFIENIISKNVLEKMASEKMDFSFDRAFFNIIYVGRLAKEKGLFNSLDAIEILIRKGYKIKWHLIGWGDQQEPLAKKAADKGISENVVFLGSKSNPYPYLKNADLFLLTSFYEGKSIAIEEAKLLAKPIVITNFKSAKSQISDGENGLIAEMDAQSIASKIEIFITDEVFKKKTIDFLENNSKGNESEILKLENLING